MDDNWVEWNGGPCPVDGDVRVEVELRCGDTDTRRAFDLFWGQDIPKDDWIIAYRIIGDDE